MPIAVRRVAVLLLVAGGVLIVPAGAQAAPTVYAAASLREALPEIDGEPTYNFAGSNQLKAQIERGAPADVFASASSGEARALYRAGLCTRPRTFATNVVVVLVPAAGRTRVRSIHSLARGARKRVAVGAPGVPVGDYTRRLLARMGLMSILRRNVVSREASVSGITSKVALGSADAGFAYATDARAAGARVRSIAIPSWAQPPVRYGVCAVRRHGADTAAATAFIRKVTSHRGRAILRTWRFGVPPRG